MSMASAAPTASSTKETTNYARLCRLLVDVGTQALRDSFDAIHAPANLHTVLAGNKTTLQSLRTRKIINATQWGKLFPAITTSVSTAHFDTTLLMVLVRNICGLPSPVTGWDKIPAVADVSREADIARVKYFRNTVYAHAEHASVDDATFNTYWQDIRDTLVRLGGVQYRAAIDNLENECMDPEIEDHYKELLSQWKKDEDNVKEKLNEIMRKLDDLKAANEASENTPIVSSEGKYSSPKEMMHGPVMCKEKYHEKEAVEYYCQECEDCICHKCSVMSHNQHNKMDIQQAIEEQKLQMTKSFEKAKAKLVVVETKMNEQIELMKKSEEEISVAEKHVTEFTEEIIRMVREHETDTKKELAVFKESQQSYHANNLENFQLFATQLRSSVEYGEGIVQRNIGPEILQAGRAVLGCCEELLYTQENEVFKPQHVTFLVDEEKAGELVISHTDPSNSAAEGKGLRETELGAKTDFTIITRDSEGNQFYNEEDQIIVKIRSSTGEDKEKNVEDRQDGNYIVYYSPNSVGLYDIAVEVNKKPLTDSPWSVQVTPHQYKFLHSFGSTGKGRGEFDSPCSIAVGERTGNIAVADEDNKRVQLFDSEFKYLRTIGDKWASAKRISKPLSVAFTASGDVIVIHGERTQTYKMSIFTECGQFNKQIRENLDDPFAVSVTTDGRMVVSDCGDGTITVLSPDGTELLQAIKDPDLDESPLFAVNHQGMYFASYGNAHCVKVFNKEGEFLYDIGSEGSGDGQLGCPSGIVIDKFNNLIVCDGENNRLQVFALDGKFVNSVKGEMKVPWSVAVTKDGHMLVCDILSDCIQVFQ
ncbi:hypothetical protein ACROYT_G006702 [Oculina patagonica]